MRRADEFALAFNGVRARSGTIELALASVETEDSAGFQYPKVGFIVSKKVGNSVKRHRITRQCRHIVRLWINNAILKNKEYLVIRVLPGCAGTPSAILAQDMEKALNKCRQKAKRQGIGEKK